MAKKTARVEWDVEPGYWSAEVGSIWLSVRLVGGMGKPSYQARVSINGGANWTSLGTFGKLSEAKAMCVWHLSQPLKDSMHPEGF
jgi:hypothetical protein